LSGSKRFGSEILGRLTSLHYWLSRAKAGFWRTTLDRPYQLVVPSRCCHWCFLDHPHLAERWIDLFAVLKLAFWGREYHGGASFSDCTLRNLAYGLEAQSQDCSSVLPWTAGRVRGAER
jgi:hypothetical protein